MINIEYIKSHYIERESLLLFADIKSDLLNHLIEKELVPGPSYVIELRIKISSPLEDEAIEYAKEEYFGKHVLSIIEHYKNEQIKAIEFKNRFRENFRKELLLHKDKTYAYDNIFDENNCLIEDEFNMIFESEWTAYCKGIYGICTFNSTENEIIKKEILVKKLIEFNEKYISSRLDDKQKDILIELNKEFNLVARLFAPYQRNASSRGKYLDRILKQVGLLNEIKGYEQ